MQRKDLEKMAFLYLCSEKDRKLLFKQEEMKFYDFRRLLFLTHHMKIHDFYITIWNEFVVDFMDNIDALEEIHSDCDEKEFIYWELEFDLKEQDKWIEDFIENSPEDMREWTRNYMHTQDPIHENLIDMMNSGIELV